ncbi:MAG TPA: hypothetical protein VNK82_07295 [Terriglobales bacterium]|nr:hypothetical protein [Terriglobales bacterium]
MRPIGAFLVCCVVSLPALAQPPTNPPYLAEFPSVERVKSELKGADAMDTAARQMGAFWQLQETIRQMAASQRRQLTADERRLIGQYGLAYQAAGQPYQSYPDRPKWYQAHAFYETNRDFRDQVLGRFLPPSLLAQVPGARTDVAGRGRSAARTTPQDGQQAAAQQRGPNLAADVLRQRKPSDAQRAMARCLALGNSEERCVNQVASRQLSEEWSSYMPWLKQERSPGMYFTGVYSGPGRFSITFYGETSSVACADVQGQGAPSAGYAIERTANGLQIRLFDSASASGAATTWQGQRIVLPLRSDGKLAAAGTIRVAGQIPVGTRQTTRTETSTEKVYSPTAQYSPFAKQDWGGWYTEEKVSRSVPATETIWAPKTVTCTLAPLTPTAKVASQTSLSEGLASGLVGALQVLAGAASGQPGAVGSALEAVQSPAPDPGLRIHGQYFGAEGLELEFYPTSAVVGCRQALVARDYTVTFSGSRVFVKIANDASPMTFELTPAGTLTGSGQVQVDGRVLVGLDSNDRPNFQPVSDICAVSTLAPAGTAAGKAAAAAAATSLRHGDARLTIRAQPGTRLTLLKESMETALTQRGVRLPAGSARISSWMAGCGAEQAECLQTMMEAMQANGVATLMVNPDGKAQFPPVPAATYYVFGMGEHSGRFMLWHVQVEMEPGESSVTLDHRNGESLEGIQ